MTRTPDREPHTSCPDPHRTRGNFTRREQRRTGLLLPVVDSAPVSRRYPRAHVPARTEEARRTVHRPGSTDVAKDPRRRTTLGRHCTGRHNFIHGHVKGCRTVGPRPDPRSGSDPEGTPHESGVKGGTPPLLSGGAPSLQFRPTVIRPGCPRNDEGVNTSPLTPHLSPLLPKLRAGRSESRRTSPSSRIPPSPSRSIRLPRTVTPSCARVTPPPPGVGPGVDSRRTYDRNDNPDLVPGQDPANTLYHTSPPASAPREKETDLLRTGTLTGHSPLSPTWVTS